MARRAQRGSSHPGLQRGLCDGVALAVGPPSLALGASCLGVFLRLLYPRRRCLGGPVCSGLGLPLWWVGFPAARRVARWSSCHRRRGRLRSCLASSYPPSARRSRAGWQLAAGRRVPAGPFWPARLLRRPCHGSPRGLSRCGGVRLVGCGGRGFRSCQGTQVWPLGAPARLGFGPGRLGAARVGQ